MDEKCGVEGEQAIVSRQALWRDICVYDQLYACTHAAFLRPFTFPPFLPSTLLSFIFSPSQFHLVCAYPASDI